MHILKHFVGVSMEHSYGNFTSKKIEDIYVLWHKAIRRIFKLPYRTHCNLLPLIVNDLPIDVQLHLRFLKFSLNSVSSDNDIIAICAKHAINNGKS